MVTIDLLVYYNINSNNTNTNTGSGSLGVSHPENFLKLKRS